MGVMVYIELAAGFHFYSINFLQKKKKKSLFWHYNNSQWPQEPGAAKVYYFSFTGGATWGTFGMWCGASSTAMQYFVV